MARVSTLILAALVLAGCATTPPKKTGFATSLAPELDYQSPKGPAADSTRFGLRTDRTQSVSRVVQALGDPRFDLTYQDADAGLVIASFKADPSEFLDCGVLNVRSTQGQANRLEAASQTTRYEVPTGADRYAIVDRTLQLDSRMIVEIKPRGAGESEVGVSGDYILTRTVNVTTEPGKSTIGQQFADFGSGDVGSFEDGRLKCVSNGKLENYLSAALRKDGDVMALSTSKPAAAQPVAATKTATTAAAASAGAATSGNSKPLLARVEDQFAAFSCAQLSAASAGGSNAIVSGFVGSGQDFERLQNRVRGIPDIGDVAFRVNVAPGSFCEILSVTAPLMKRNEDGRSGARVRMANGTFDLVEGEFLLIDATAPDFGGYVYVMYAQQDGMLLNMFPHPQRQNNFLNAGQKVRLGEEQDGRRYEVAPPFGNDLVTLIVSSEPLFTNARPEVESTADMALDLRSAIAKVEAKGGEIVADMIFITTAPRTI